jgi:hypothetical protein
MCRGERTSVMTLRKAKAGKPTGAIALKTVAELPTPVIVVTFRGGDVRVPGWVRVDSTNGRLQTQQIRLLARWLPSSCMP